MTYKLRTVDGKFNRLLNDEDFRTVLRIALQYGWTPSPHHYRDGRLWLNEVFDEQEAKALAAAIDKAIKREGGTLLPPVVVAFLECIGVLRRGPSKFFYVTPQ